LSSFEVSVAAGKTVRTSGRKASGRRSERIHGHSQGRWIHLNKTKTLALEFQEKGCEVENDETDWDGAYYLVCSVN
jgi:hypothetical protein